MEHRETSSTQRPLNRRRFLQLAGLAGGAALLTYRKPVLAQSDSEVRITILHVNDIYEIIPVSGGTLGGVARLATLKKQLLTENPNTFLTMGGDLHGPSGLGEAMVNGEKLAGEQNVATMNKVGVDYFTYGDHEFDIYTGEQHTRRLQEAEFTTVSSNVFDANGDPLFGAIVNDIFTVANPAGDTVSIGLFALSEPIPRSEIEITYVDHTDAATEQVAELAAQVDILIALTHFTVSVDVETAQSFPQIDLIVGGDDHENMKEEPGAGLAPIYKADSNARSAWIIDLYYDTATDTLRIEDQNVVITDVLADDPDVLAEVNKWKEIAFDAFRADGIEPTEVVAVPTVDLDGFADSIRNGPTELTKLMVEGIQATATDPALSFMFSALIRTDDLIPAGGDFTMYDVIRTFPNNFDIVSIDIPGAGLEFVLNFGEQSAGTGQYILRSQNVTQDNDGNWLIDGEPLVAEQTYRAGTTAEAAAAFVDLGATLVETHDLDLQELLVQQLKNAFPKFTAYFPTMMK